MRLITSSILVFAGAIAFAPLQAQEASIDASKTEQVRAKLAKLTPEQKQATVLAAIKILEDGQKTAAEKVGAIRSLELLQSPDSVSALSKLLGDATLADEARAALQRIPSAAVPAALLGALRTTTDAKLQAGFLESLGRLREKSAVPVIADLLKSSKDVRVLEASVRALGSIGSAEAFAVLKNASLSPAQVELQKDVLLDIAEKLLSSSKSGADIASIKEVLENFSKDSADTDIRFSSWLLRIRYSLTDAGAALTSGDKVVRSAALAFLSSAQDTESSKTLITLIGTVKGADAKAVLGAIANRHLSAAAPALRSRIGSESDADTKAEFIKTLGQIGSAADVAFFAALLKEKGDFADAANEALKQVRGEGVPAAFVALITNASSGSEVRKELLGISYRRPLPQVTEGILPVLNDPDGDVRIEALKAVERLSSKANLPALEKVNATDKDVASRLQKLIKKLRG
ncbi:MAG: HEAT repeat domain-containing protein [Puniceicoccales bacterium]|jgi:HEAT repeat protein|nr:HEAT repeat domain-containing protein [Puniceicoccales bacterium]